MGSLVFSVTNSTSSPEQFSNHQWHRLSGSWSSCPKQSPKFSFAPLHFYIRRLIQRDERNVPVCVPIYPLYDSRPARLSTPYRVCSLLPFCLWTVLTAGDGRNMIESMFYQNTAAGLVAWAIADNEIGEGIIFI